ncbi:MAG: c-type cytochrome [Chloroflexota bacterium]
MNHKLQHYYSLLVFTILFLITPTSLLAQQPEPPEYDAAAVPIPLEPPMAPLGEALYAQNCMPCHGLSGNSDGPVVPNLPAPPPPFADPETIWEKSPGEYFHTTKFGRIQNLMPPWGNQMSDEEIWQAVMYAWSLHTDQETVEWGAELYTGSCAACHGPQGQGDGPEAASALTDFSDRAAMNIRTQAELYGGWQTAHPELGQTWSQAEQRAALDYIRTFSYVPPWGSVFQPGDGKIEGQVEIGTAVSDIAGSDTAISDTVASLAGMDIQVTAYVNRNGDFEATETFQTVTDEDGRFMVDNLSLSSSIVYVAQTRYQEVLYDSAPVQLTSDTPLMDALLTVYETTDDGSTIYLSRANWVIDFEPGSIIFGQILSYGNSGDRTYIGQPLPELVAQGVPMPVTAMFPIPAGATSIQLQNGILGGRYHQIEGQIVDTAAILPGEQGRQIFVGYRLLVDDPVMEVSQDYRYAVSNFNLLVADLPDLVTEVSPLADEGGLTFIGTESIQGIDYTLWNGTDIEAQTIVVNFEGLMQADDLDERDFSATNPGAGAAGTGAAGAAGDGTMTSRPPESTQPLEPVIPISLGVIAVLLLAGAFIWPMMRNRNIDAKTRQRTLQEYHDELVVHIAELDDERAAGKLDEKTWQQERSQLKNQLLTVARQLK